MKKSLLIVLGVIVLIALLLVIPFIKTNNSLVSLDENVNNTYSQIQTQMQRRADLIPNLVETVKGYATHESETLTKVTEARSNVNKAIQNSSNADENSINELQKANDELNIAINAVVEAYPDLKANQNFIGLQDELAGAENRIAKARKDYNDAVQIFNSKVRTFPTAIFAKFLGYSAKPYFEASAGAETVPNVNFNK